MTEEIKENTKIDETKIREKREKKVKTEEPSMVTNYQLWQVIDGRLHKISSDSNLSRASKLNKRN